MPLFTLAALGLILTACTGEPTPGDDTAAMNATGSESSSTDATTNVDTGTEETETTGVPVNCHEGPFGIEVGEVFGEFEWVRGDGTPLFTTDLCGVDQRAIVLYGTAAW